MDKSDLETVKYIKRYCEDIAVAIKRFGSSYEVFSKDTDFYNSVSMSIMQIGELSARLSDEFKDITRTQMPWGLIKGMRNHFAHAYAAMERGDVWETATEDIPNLLSFCEKIIEANDINFPR
jgi:uncharacterized protein with HEPN domain